MLFLKRIRKLVLPMTTIDAMSDEIMKGMTEYADLADTAMKKTVRKTAKSVKDEISANAPKRTGAYSKSWTAKKTKAVPSPPSFLRFVRRS